MSYRGRVSRANALPLREFAEHVQQEVWLLAYRCQEPLRASRHGFCVVAL